MQKINTYIQDSLQSTYSPQELKSIKSVLSTDILGLNQMDVYLGKDI